VTEILTEPVSAPNVWRGDELADTGRWIIRFAEEDLADFERALAHVSNKRVKDVTEIRAEDFPLPHFQERIDDVVDRLENGLGLVLLRGLPICDRFTEDEATIIYCRSAPSTRSGAAATRRDRRPPSRKQPGCRCVSQPAARRTGILRSAAASRASTRRCAPGAAKR
jgi:hypothetical protein